MNKHKYSIGLDFGTLSARAIIANAENGKTLPYESVFIYPHAVMTQINNQSLPQNYALQHPQDYVDALDFLICDVLTNNDIDKNSIIGIGIDFTDCTVLPISKDFTPLCLLEKYKNEPHAYAKIWKHHASEKYAKAIENAALSYDKSILSVTGEKMTGEFLIPKLYETFCEAPELYDETYKFIFAGDFIASLLIGKKEIHSKAYSAKQHYKNNKFPAKEFFASVNPDFAGVYEEKTITKLSSVELPIGTLCKEWAKKTGLSESVAIAAPILDAHGAISAAKIETGRIVLALGTSAVVETLTEQNINIKGILATSYESVANGFTTIEAGLAAMGDLFDWFIKNCVPENYTANAKKSNLSIHQYLRSLAQEQQIGDHGLLILDWFNGSRSIILDDNLSGLIVGLTLSTKPEDIYRALIESTSFGIRRILDCFKAQGVEIKSISATGGITLKDPFLMQILSSVLNMPIECLSSKQATALGSAIYGAVAADAYSSVKEASQAMHSPTAITYYPIKEDNEKYEKIYEQYLKLCDYFQTENPIMNFLSDNRR
ncbi:MAG: ribulokinase [Ruminococcaceae bacterium]|nr:ribulokinase [Oscillospiraceae bacterium]